MTALHLARARDPLTSHMAAQRSRVFANAHKERILAAMAVCLKVFPDRGATAHEIAAESGLPVVQVSRRLHELQTACRVRVLLNARGWGEMWRGGYRCWGLVAE